MPRGKTKTQVCNKCSKDVSLFAFNRHFKTCKGVTTKDKRVAWNKGLTKETDERVAKNAASIAISANLNPLHGKCNEPEKELARRKKLSEKAKEHKFGGYRANAGRSKKFQVVDSFGKQTTLQSTFELKCSEVLNNMGIRWIRPGALMYDGRKYFADFYLPDYDVWLDPKNSYKAVLDEEKIRKVKEQTGVKLFVLLEDQITQEYISRII